MAQENLIKKAQYILDLADVKINGGRPWDIKVKNNQLYNRVILGGSIALGNLMWTVGGMLNGLMIFFLE